MQSTVSRAAHNRVKDDLADALRLIDTLQKDATNWHNLVKR